MSATKSEDAIGAKGRPFTGAEYLASLRDGREVYVYGERVDDVTTHPAFRNAARSIARLYDALHDEKTKDLLTSPTDTGSGGYTHKFFRAARSRDELIAQRDAIAQWARMSYGWMGRSPDYKASLMNTLGANHQFYGKFSGNAKAWYRRAQEYVLFMNHAIVNPPLDRAKAPDQVKDVFITIQKETDAGIYVSGAKVVATSSALTHYNFLGQNAAVPTHDTDLAVMFIAPMNAPGVKLLCRTSYEMMASVMGTPFDYPLSSRFDENDAIFVFDNAFVPWEDVLLHRDLEKLKIFFPQSGFLAGYQFQGCTRLAVKLDFLVGIIAKALRTTGADEFRGNQAMLGEVIAWRNLFWALTDAMAANPTPWVDGAVLPNVQSCVRGRSLRTGQGNRGEDRRLGAHLPPVVGQGLQESRHRQVPREICARLARHRLQGAHQGDEASVGRDRHRVWRPPRTLRDELRRQPRGHPHPGDVERAHHRHARQHDRARGSVSFRLRRERLARWRLARPG
jgi:4-hydroxyphenylacetate 3-monooxygenase